MHTPRQHLTAVVVLFLVVSEFVLATPGLDLLGPTELMKAKSRQRMNEQPLGFVVVAAADFNRAVRIPINQALTPLQRPLRIAQSWGLYGSGPSEVNRMEILVDGALIHRSKDPEHTWLSGPLTYRRLRPIVNATCSGNSKNDEHLVRYIVNRARADYGQAREVVVRCTQAPYPGTDAPTESQRYTANAPDWTVTR